MAQSDKGDYSDDEIEQILGMTAPEGRLTLQQVRDTIREDPLLVTGLVFALGILVGASLARGAKKHG